MKKTSLTPPARTRKPDDTYVRASSAKPASNPVIKSLPSSKNPSRGGLYNNITPPPLAGTKTKMSVDDLLAQADLLDPADRKSLLDRMSLVRRSATKTGELRDVEMWSLAAYTALVDAAGTGDGSGQGPAAVKRQVGSPAAFAPVAEFMAASKLSTLKANERQSVYSLLAGLVVARAKSVASHSRIPLGAKLVATCSAQVAAVFEDSFPGYLANGLALMVARQLVNHRPAESI